ncbi:phosphopentomutase [Oceanicola granulosus HTCC2516]|uniref:Phosphopentomutase n=1 Tax=Oceanicola granulosus (strain ATCC BAA-861 / DSM 15982 / KCTC 12143 / HTCC2516) TaxID=314256 RepID=Q2CGX2_OCEGH|nr:phosphopentomutase [Oceanicola granulosus]EAR52039.1 phosphopentomutase [Oceanicola granulosus HTCC2516]
MSRAFLIVIDSVGIGGAPDAGEFFNDGVPDSGANTVGHIAEAVGLEVPVLERLGLGAALDLASGVADCGLALSGQGAWGAATEVSRGKDTPSGHWELTGVPVPWDWHSFPDRENSFPADLVAEVCRLAGTGAILGNRHASGTNIIEEEGERHLETGWPICYTSVDSVFQIAAHEEAFGLERLLDLCAALAPRLHEMRVGRVIARPFVGAPGDFRRTQNRKDFAIAPPSPTLCDWAAADGRPVHAVGKIGDIFSMRGITDVAKGDDRALMGHLVRLADTAEDGSLTFANFVEFDSLYGHRRDPVGYRDHLEWFDTALGDLLGRMRAGDLLIVTADHGNDPTWIGTDHTRERVPVLCHGLGARPLGQRAFTDVAASVAAHLGLTERGPGTSFL